jgi:hypothetical protein
MSVPHNSNPPGTRSGEFEEVIENDLPPSTDRVIGYVTHLVDQFDASVVNGTREFLSAAKELADGAVQSVSRRRPLITSPEAQQALDGLVYIIDMQFRLSEDLLTRWHGFGRDVLRTARPLWSDDRRPSLERRLDAQKSKKRRKS